MTSRHGESVRSAYRDAQRELPSLANEKEEEEARRQVVEGGEGRKGGKGRKPGFPLEYAQRRRETACLRQHDTTKNTPPTRATYNFPFIFSSVDFPSSSLLLSPQRFRYHSHFGSCIARRMRASCERWVGAKRGKSGGRSLFEGKKRIRIRRERFCQTERGERARRTKRYQRRVSESPPSTP